MSSMPGMPLRLGLSLSLALEKWISPVFFRSMSRPFSSHHRMHEIKSFFSAATFVDSEALAAVRRISSAYPRRGREREDGGMLLNKGCMNSMNKIGDAG